MAGRIDRGFGFGPLGGVGYLDTKLYDENQEWNGIILRDLRT